MNVNAKLTKRILEIIENIIGRGVFLIHKNFSGFFLQNLYQTHHISIVYFIE